jgi:alkylhydroperoxidase/carboxymuconolactone decarboxylase family protein YurZ
MEDTMMKKLAASLVMSSFAASAAEAQERPTGRIAPPEVYAVAPALGDYTDDLLFGDVWQRDELAPRDRSIVTVSALIASGRIAQVGGHVGRALDNGVTPGEIGEIITQLAFYSGWPNAISAVYETKEVFDARGIGELAADPGEPLELDPTSEAAREAAVNNTVGPVAPALAEYTNRVLFGDLWRRPELSARDRSLVTMAGLIATGQAEQLPFHVDRGMDNGLTQTEVAEVPTASMRAGRRRCRPFPFCNRSLNRAKPPHRKKNQQPLLPCSDMILRPRSRDRLRTSPAPSGSSPSFKPNGQRAPAERRSISSRVPGPPGIRIRSARR